VGKKKINTLNIHKEMFHVYDGKCLSCKAVHNWVEKRGKYSADDEEVETEVWKWLRYQKTSMLRVSTQW
jgi:predicted DCC family thiol-disulfide oxidoreductase YuxK